MSQNFKLSAGGQRWEGLRWGSGYPQLLLHGWLDNAASFSALAPLLGGDCVAPDLPGHGRSFHRPAGTWYHFVDYVYDIVSLIDALGWQRFVLIGHSMGGAIATLLAATYPERVERLVLIEALGPLARDSSDLAGDMRRALDARRELAGKQLKVHADIDAAVRARAAAGDLSPGAARTLVERAVKRVPGGFVWRSDPRQTLPTPMRATEAQYLSLLGSIRAPTTIVLADPATPYLAGPAAEQRIAALRPERLIRIGGGHHLHMEDAAAVANAISG
jgi:pimeloyl-ACP methyl ester carboxylesterase